MANLKKLQRKLIALLASDTDEMPTLQALGVQPLNGKTRKELIAELREKLQEKNPLEPE